MINQNQNEIWKVKEIEMNGIKYRLYNEASVSSEFTLYLETSIKMHKLIEKYKYKIYNLKTSPKTNLKLKLDSDKKINIFDEDIKKIKFYQSNDFLYLYYNIFFEVFYAIPHINEFENYSYELLVIVQHDFDITKISKHNFNLVNIESCTEIKKEEINFDFIKFFFENRSIIKNSTLRIGEKKYDYEGHELTEEEFIRDYNNGEKNYNIQKKINADSFKHRKMFNQNFYVQLNFKCLCTHIWDFGRVYYIEENSYGRSLQHDDLYEDIGLFFTNFGQLGDLKVAEINDGELEINSIENYHCTLAENCTTWNIHSCALSKEFVLNGFINIENKEVRISKNGEKTSITDIIV